MAAAAPQAAHQSPLLNGILNTHFSKERYSKDKKQEAFHFLVALEYPIANLWKWAKIVDQNKHPQYYSAPQTPMQLTPLHVAAMKGHRAAAALFIEHKAPLHAQDKRGWTPLHHAAARGDREMMQILGGDDPQIAAIRNLWGATAHDFLAMQKPPEIPPDRPDRIVCRLELDGKIEACTATRFEEVTGARYTDRVIATTDGLYSEWLYEPIEYSPTSQAVATHYVLPQLPKERPLLTLRKREGVGLEVTTHHKIDAGTLLGEYTGILSCGREHTAVGRDASYLFETVDGLKDRNLIPMLNDGPPLVALNVCPNYEGLPRRGFMIALQNIGPGTPLTWDYGPHHPIKWGLYQLSPDQIEHIKTSWNSAFLPTQQGASPLEVYKNLSEQCYLLTTPDALLYGILENPTLDLERMISEIGSSFGLTPTDPTIAKLLTFIKAVRSFREALEHLPEADREGAKAFSLRIFNRYERIFAPTVLERLKQMLLNPDARPFLRSKPQKTEKGIIVKYFNEAIIFLCQKTKATREQAAKTGTDVGIYPVDLDAVQARLKQEQSRLKQEQ